MPPPPYTIRPASLRNCGRLSLDCSVSVESGARTSVYLASSPEVEGISGRYFDKCKPRHPSRRAQDAELARKLWDASAQLTHV